MSEMQRYRQPCSYSRDKKPFWGQPEEALVPEVLLGTFQVLWSQRYISCSVTCFNKLAPAIHRELGAGGGGEKRPI